MTRQIAFGYGAPSRADLENRIHALEVKVISLTEAVTLLARALENGPPAGADRQAAVAKASREAHDLLIHRRHDVEPTEPGKPGRPAGE